MDLGVYVNDYVIRRPLGKRYEGLLLMSITFVHFCVVKSVETACYGTGLFIILRVAWEMERCNLQGHVSWCNCML